MGAGENENVVVQVPFSEFVRRVKKDEIHTVYLDGLHVNFGLRPSSSALANLPEGSEKARITFATVRPGDYSVPYDILEANGVQFSAIDKRNNKLLTVMVSHSRTLMGHVMAKDWPIAEVTVRLRCSVYCGLNSVYLFYVIYLSSC